MQREITTRQHEVLSFIRSHQLAKGYPPTMREIGMHMGIRSPNAVHDHLQALVRHGVLRRVPHTARGLVLL